LQKVKKKEEKNYKTWKAVEQFSFSYCEGVSRGSKIVQPEISIVTHMALSYNVINLPYKKTQNRDSYTLLVAM
jgi:hypothetical protein